MDSFDFYTDTEGPSKKYKCSFFSLYLFYKVLSNAQKNFIRFAFENRAIGVFFNRYQLSKFDVDI